MPRQLPWKSGGGGSRTQTTKPTLRPQKTTKAPDDIDDNFFDHTALAGSSKGKNKARAIVDSDESLPEPTTPRTERARVSNPEPRAASSSPPPLAEDAIPNEPMRKGASNFDLRDDEWMMVEDEFLETAKLFTRHLHIAEYDRLKETIEAKKKEAEIARPVVADPKRSVEGVMKERAKAQESRQKKAIRDVFSSLGDKSGEDRATRRVEPAQDSLALKPLPAVSRLQDSDSDDLDAPRPSKLKRAAPALATASAQQPPHLPVSKPTISTFARPALSSSAANARPRAKSSRMTPFEMLDGYTRPASTTRASPTIASGDLHSQSTSTHSSPRTSKNTKTVKCRRSVDLLDDWGLSNDGGNVSKGAAERIAKRKAERAKEGDGGQKKRTTRLDDIPTFLI